MAAFAGSLRRRSCDARAWNTSLLIVLSNGQGLITRSFPDKAPITLIRPFACQSCLPKQCFIALVTDCSFGRTRPPDRLYLFQSPPYSTVTLFAKFLGLSTSVPFCNAA